MSLESLVRKADASYLYCGSYRARGCVSAAQLAAWGMQQRSFQPARPQTIKAPVQRDAPTFHVRITAPPSRDAFTSSPPQHQSQRPARRRLVLISSRVVGSCFKRLAHQTPTFRRSKGLMPYRRFVAVIRGRHVVCIVFRGQCFAAAAGSYGR